MIRDAIIICRKELRGFFAYEDIRVRVLIGGIIFGLLFPFLLGKDAIIVLPFMCWWLAQVFVLQSLATGIAGERERGTLESLLVTRLSVRSFLWGKLFGAILFGSISTFYLVGCTVLGGFLFKNPHLYSSQAWLLILFGQVGGFATMFSTGALAIVISSKARSVHTALLNSKMMMLGLSMVLIIPVSLGGNRARILFGNIATGGSETAAFIDVITYSLMVGIFGLLICFGIIELINKKRWIYRL